MHELLDIINSLKTNELHKLIKERIKEFNAFRDKSPEEIFRELCFCIMTANCSAEKCIEVQDLVGKGFNNLHENGLAQKLKKYGYRFPNIRAKYILEARNYQNELLINLHTNKDSQDLREWIVKNIKGIGYKEASHFLRNIGYTDYAIIDFHIIDLLTKHNLIEKPKTLTKKKYLEMEKLLSEIAEVLDVNLAELDLYMWYIETGKVLK
ncbi:MAG: N-glycosylase/DNA lyase [Promethearchaeota archaeon]